MATTAGCLIGGSEMGKILKAFGDHDCLTLVKANFIYLFVLSPHWFGGGSLKMMEENYYLGLLRQFIELVNYTVFFKYLFTCGDELLI